MKRAFGLLGGVWLLTASLSAQPQAWTTFIDSARLAWAGPASTLLKKTEQKDFAGVLYFPYDSASAVRALYSPLTNTDTVYVPTTRGPQSRYLPIATVRFVFARQADTLTVYRGLDPWSEHDRHFLMFTDASNGQSTYGGGRYLELRDVAPGQDSVTVDFNYSYNPYCAYSSRYSCPIPPPHNDVAAPIRAGAAYPHHEDGWTLAMAHDADQPWSNTWFLDGLRAEVRPAPNGFHFAAGPQEKDDGCHGVLWTQQIFQGDLKVSYTYTRTDTRTRYVNILYLLANGAADKPEDIAEWNEERVIPSMRTYFNHMDALHISYAAQRGDGSNYVRARVYPVPQGQRFPSTALSPTYFNTDFFRPGIRYDITATVTDTRLRFEVTGDGLYQVFAWDLPAGAHPGSGRIGLRHMYTRSARYEHFQVHTR